MRKAVRHDALSELCQNLRHELNNPLTGILGNAEMALACPDLPPQLERRLRNILLMAERIREVLRALESPDPQSAIRNPQ